MCCEPLTPGHKNVKNDPLVNPDDIILPPLHIKFDLINNFVKAMPKDGSGFLYLKEKFPKLSEAKFKRESLISKYNWIAYTANFLKPVLASQDGGGINMKIKKLMIMKFYILSSNIDKYISFK